MVKNKKIEKGTWKIYNQRHRLPKPGSTEPTFTHGSFGSISEEQIKKCGRTYVWKVWRPGWKVVVVHQLQPGASSTWGWPISGVDIVAMVIVTTWGEGRSLDSRCLSIFRMWSWPYSPPTGWELNIKQSIKNTDLAREHKCSASTTEISYMYRYRKPDNWL